MLQSHKIKCLVLSSCPHLDALFSFVVVVQFKETVSFFGWNPEVGPLLALTIESVDEVQLSDGGHRYKISPAMLSCGEILSGKAFQFSLAILFVAWIW